MEPAENCVDQTHNIYMQGFETGIRLALQAVRDGKSPEEAEWVCEQALRVMRGDEPTTA